MFRITLTEYRVRSKSEINNISRKCKTLKHKIFITNSPFKKVLLILKLKVKIYKILIPADIVRVSDLLLGWLFVLPWEPVEETDHDGTLWATAKAATALSTSSQKLGMETESSKIYKNKCNYFCISKLINSYTQMKVTFCS